MVVPRSGHHFPIGAWRWPKAASAATAANGPVVRGPLVPSDAFVVLWSGPFESWSDPAGPAARSGSASWPPAPRSSADGEGARGADALVTRSPIGVGNPSLPRVG